MKNNSASIRCELLFIKGYPMREVLTLRTTSLPTLLSYILYRRMSALILGGVHKVWVLEEHAAPENSLEQHTLALLVLVGGGGRRSSGFLLGGGLLGGPTLLTAASGFVGLVRSTAHIGRIRWLLAHCGPTSYLCNIQQASANTTDTAKFCSEEHITE